MSGKRKLVVDGIGHWHGRIAKSVIRVRSVECLVELVFLLLLIFLLQVAFCQLQREATQRNAAKRKKRCMKNFAHFSLPQTPPSRRVKIMLIVDCRPRK